MKKPEEVTSEIKEKAIIYNKPKNEHEDMESQKVQNSRSKIVFKFNKFFYQGQERFQSSSSKSSHVQRIFFQGHGIF